MAEHQALAALELPQQVLQAVLRLIAQRQPEPRPQPAVKELSAPLQFQQPARIVQSGAVAVVAAALLHQWLEALAAVHYGVAEAAGAVEVTVRHLVLLLEGLAVPQIALPLVAAERLEQMELHLRSAQQAQTELQRAVVPVVAAVEQRSQQRLLEKQAEPVVPVVEAEAVAELV